MDDLRYNEKKEPKLGWNWGAFMFPFQFGIGTKAYLTLLTLVPILNFIWFFVSGSQGAKWAYDSGYFENVDEFNGAMKSWNRAGLVSAIIIAVVLALYFLLFVWTIGMFSQLKF
jgi:hypothetical protein